MPEKQWQVGEPLEGSSGPGRPAGLGWAIAAYLLLLATILGLRGAQRLSGVARGQLGLRGVRGRPAGVALWGMQGPGFGALARSGGGGRRALAARRGGLRLSAVAARLRFSSGRPSRVEGASAVALGRLDLVDRHPSLPVRRAEQTLQDGADHLQLWGQIELLVHHDGAVAFGL